ncbi:MAG: hypothetical protein AAFW98_19445, partial [Pseudomonadota bacterium]
MDAPTRPAKGTRLFPHPATPPTAPEPFAGTGSVEITPEFEAFDQSNDMFSRGFWDAAFSNRLTQRFFRSFVKPQERMREEDGFTQADYAIRNGPWVVTEMFAEMNKAQDRRDGFTDDFSAHIPPKVEPADVGTPQEAAAAVKKVAKIYGADLVGITQYDPRWTYRT